MLQVPNNGTHSIKECSLFILEVIVHFDYGMNHFYKKTRKRSEMNKRPEYIVSIQLHEHNSILITKALVISKDSNLCNLVLIRGTN